MATPISASSRRALSAKRVCSRLESIILSSIFRWTMVAGLVIMGYSVLQAGGPGAETIAQDSEQVLPVVLGQLLPAGVRGLVIAGLIAAAMSTFDSTLNAGAAYIVRDIYQSYINPKANAKQLMRMSKLATVALCIVGVAFAAIVPNINKIWGLITMGIGAGMFVPGFLRWYWPRFNGYGFAVGTAAGMLAALIFQAGLDWPLYLSFPTVIGSAFVGAVGTSLLTRPTDDSILVRFVVQINPWGFLAQVHAHGDRPGRDRGEGQPGPRSRELEQRHRGLLRSAVSALPAARRDELHVPRLGAVRLLHHRLGRLRRGALLLLVPQSEVRRTVNAEDERFGDLEPTGTD